MARLFDDVFWDHAGPGPVADRQIPKRQHNSIHSLIAVLSRGLES